MKKIAFLLVILLAGFACAETIKEETFASMGYGEELVVEGANKTECKEIVFYDEFNQEEFMIISIHSIFVPKIKGDANIEVYLNEKKISVIEPPKEYERIIVQKKDLEEKNTLKICAFTSDSITKITVKNDSMIGNYKTAFFPEGSFKKEVVSKELVLGKEIQIKTSLKNFGNETAYVEITDGDADREDIKLIKGNSAFKGEIAPGEEKVLEFTYRLKYEGTGVLPNAKAVYLNEFGEEEKIETEYPEIKVQALDEKALEPVIMLKKQVNSVEEKSEIEIVIINNSLKAIYSAELKVFSSELGFEEKKVFEVIQSKEIVYFKTAVDSSEAGEFELECELDFEGKKTECTKTIIIFEEDTIDRKVIVGAVLVAIGIIVYLYLYLK